MDELRELIDQAFEHWKAIELNKFPDEDDEDAGVPAEMRDGETDDDGWVAWKTIPSTVSEDDIAALEQELGTTLPPQYVALLRHRHFVELYWGEIGLSHPSGRWREVIRERVFDGYPREEIFDRGLLPIGDYSDWGLVCLALGERDADGECAVVLWDHERPDDPEPIAPTLLEALREEQRKARSEDG